MNRKLLQRLMGAPRKSRVLLVSPSQFKKRDRAVDDAVKFPSIAYTWPTDLSVRHAPHKPYE